MRRSHLPGSSGSPLPERFMARLVEFAHQFTRPTWPHVVVLLAGAILAPGRRTVTAALHILGRDHDNDFCTFHRVLNRAPWSSRAVAHHLIQMLVKAFVPSDAPIVIGLDDTIERRWGAKIKARGIYRDPVRSSKGHFVKTSGLRWLSAMLLVHVPWAGRIMALPFLTLLAPSKRFYEGKPREHKTIVDWARQAVLQIHRWLPNRYIVLVADSAFAAIEFLAAVGKHVCVVTRLRLDANLFEFPPPKPKGRGRPPNKGKPHKKLSALLEDRKVPWKRCRISLWYGRTNRLVEIATGTAIWYHGGLPPIPIRWLLVRDPSGELDPQAFLATDLNAKPQDILAWFVSRWQVEVTFEEVRAHLGVETQRQWSDHSAHDAGSAGNVLSRHSVDARSRKITNTQAKDRHVVSKIRSHLQRRHRGSSPRNMASSNFLHVPAAPRQHRNSAAHLAARRKRARLRRLNRPKSS